MNEKFDEASLNEQAINDVETARLALRWALDKIRGLHEEDLKTRQNLQEKSSQVTFLENQLKSKNSEIERGTRVHEEEMKSRQDSLEYQFRSRLERLTEREKELEDKISKSEELLKQKELKLQDDYQKKSEELRGRWSQVEGELWQLRQEQLSKQQEFERVYGARLEAEKKRLNDELASQKASIEQTYQNKVEELEKRERATGDELRKQEAVLKWAKDSWQKDTEDRERGLKQKELEIDKKILEKNQEIEDHKVKVLLLEKQLTDLPEAVRRRDEDLSRYKDAMMSLEGVIKTLESEKKNQGADYESRLARMSEALEAEKNRFKEMEVEIPKRLKIAVEHERNRFAEKLQEAERNYREDMGKRQDEIDYLQRNLRTFEETIKTLQAERDMFSHKVEQTQNQYNVKLEEFSFREKQLQSEYDVRLKVEMEKHTATLRTEIETAGRIYEDSLRLKVEEISHLRRDVEELSKDKNSFKEQLAVLRRELEVAEERSQAEQASLRARMKSEADHKLSEEAMQWEKRLSAEKQRSSQELEGRGLEFTTELGRKEEELNELRLMLQKAGEEMKMVRQKASEELKAAVAEERAHGAAVTADKVSSYEDALKARDIKVHELSRAMEASRLEREEFLMHERERLQRLYAEKERALDEEASAREAELLRVKEQLSKSAAERDAAVKMHQEQEENYRRTLEDFRGKLSEALSKFEHLQKISEDRQAMIASLQAENAAMIGRIGSKEKELRDVRTEHSEYKTTFESELQEGDRKYTDAMQKLRLSEEQRAAKDKQIEQFKREGDFWRMEISRKEDEKTAMEKERAKQLADLKDSLNAKDVALSQLQTKLDTLARSEERLRAYLEEEKTQRALAEVKAEEAAADAAKKAEESERTRQLVEQLKEKMKLWKTK
jgi:chromosome segregation ATPase